MKRAVIFTLMSILVLTTFVYAIGSSTGNQNPSPVQPNSVSAYVNCETHSLVKDRIQCRLQNRTEINSIEESCRNLATTDKTSCINFQKRAGPCYDLSAREKAACMRNNAGLGSGQLNRFAAEDRRKYAALLMYELQERIEAANEEGRITDEQAAELISQIVDIKESLLNNTPIDDVKAKMTSFKQTYLGAMQ